MTTVVQVRFRRSLRTYDYYTTQQIKAGELVVVPTGSLGQGDSKAADIDHVAVAQVVKVLQAPSTKATSFIIGRINLHEYLVGAVRRMRGYQKQEEAEDFLD